MTRRILKVLLVSVMGGGFLMVLGTAGASDFNAIDFKTILIQSGIGLSLMGLSFLGLNIIDPNFFN